MDEDDNGKLRLERVNPHSAGIDFSGQSQTSISESESESEYVRDSTRLLAVSASRKKKVSERYKADLNIDRF